MTASFQRVTLPLRSESGPNAKQDSSAWTALMTQDDEVTEDKSIHVDSML